MSKFKSVKKILGGVGVCVVLTACETANSCARSALDVAANKAYGTGSENVFFSSPSVERKIAYEFFFELHAVDIEKKQKELQETISSLGGYLLTVQDNFLTVKIPKAKADEFLKKCQSFGELSNLNMNGTDMTDTIADLEMRLASQKKIQKRLIELLDKATLVEDMLKIEVQLNKVETEIERLTAQLANSNKRVDFATFNIKLSNVPIVERTDIALEQFGFLKNFINYQGGRMDEIFCSFNLPQNFVPYTSKYNGNSESFSAITADDCVLAINEYEIDDNSSFEFWTKLIEKSLKVFHACSEIKVEKVGDAIEITAITNKKGVTDSYYMYAWIEDSFWCGKKLRTVELFGEKEVFNKYLNSVKEMISVYNE